MTPERALQHPPLVLDQEARERHVEDGFLGVPGYVRGSGTGRVCGSLLLRGRQRAYRYALASLATLATSSWLISSISSLVMRSGVSTFCLITPHLSRKSM
jgi:hypothetical protein